MYKVDNNNFKEFMKLEDEKHDIHQLTNTWKELSL